MMIHSDFYSALWVPYWDDTGFMMKVVLTRLNGLRPDMTERYMLWVLPLYLSLCFALTNSTALALQKHCQATFLQDWGQIHQKQVRKASVNLRRRKGVLRRV
jgi:hypothetical protein